MYFVFRRSRVDRNFFSHSLIISAVFFAVCLVVFLTKYSFLIKEKKEQSKMDAIKIESLLTQNLLSIEKVCNFMGKEIVRQDKVDDLQFIHKLFLQTISVANFDLLSWSKFDWVDRNDNLVVNSAGGVDTKNAQNIFSQRGYVWQVKFSPDGGAWNLKFSEPTIGNMSKVNVVPMALGVSNNDGAYVGLISAGISIAKLTAKIESIISQDSQFILIDSEHYKYVSGLDFVKKDDNLQNLLDNVKKRHKYLQNDGFLTKSLQYNDIKFVYDLKMKYPFVVFVGYDKKIFWRDLLKSFLSEFFILLFIVIIAQILLIVSYKKKSFK